MNVIVLALLLSYLDIICSSNSNSEELLQSESREAQPPQLESYNNHIIRLVEDDRRRHNIRGGYRRALDKNSEGHGLLPGHSLIRPARTMLKSAVKFPHDDENLVYGNLENLGISIGAAEQTLYSGFRKENDILGALVNAIKKLNKNEKRNKQKPSIILLQPKPKMKANTLGSNGIPEVTMKLLNLLQSKKPVSIQLKPKSSKSEQDFKDLTMKARDSFENVDKGPDSTNAYSQASIASRLQEITMKALNFIENKNQKEAKKKVVSDKKKFIEKPSSGSKLKDSTLNALSMLASQNPNLFQQQIKLIPSMENKFIEALNIPDIQKFAKQLNEEDNNKKNDMSIKIQDFLGNRVPISKTPKHSEEVKLKQKKVLYSGKVPDESVNNRAHVDLEMIPRADVLLNERTKKIQDFLNSHIPVINAEPLKEDSLANRTMNVKEFLSNQVPIREARDKLSLIEKTKSIQDFLNNQVPIFLNRDSLNDRNVTTQTFTNLNLIDETENNANEILDLTSSEEEPNYRRGPKKKKKHRNRESKYDSGTDKESGLSASSDYEKNPGNPYTLHRNKYKQNWMWNHVMDGDHMNINPLGPSFAKIGPSGADLFFGRKWWYFNQDDYKPMG